MLTFVFYTTLGYEKPCSGYRPLHGFVPPHFFAPVKMLRIFSYRAQKNVKLQPERYVPFVGQY
jgi:hypothetical protein